MSTSTSRPARRTRRSGARQLALGGGVLLLAAGSVTACSASGSVTTDPAGASSPAAAPTTTVTSTAVVTASGSAPSASASGSSSSAASGSGSPAGSSPASTASTAGGGAGSAAPGGGDACRTSDLGLSWVPGPGSAGAQHGDVMITNRSGTACGEGGYPGVSFVAGSDGHQVGAAAIRTGSAFSVTLQPGESAYAPVTITDAGAYGASCQPTAVRGFRVYPPGEVDAAYVQVDGLTGCASSSVQQLTVGPVAVGRTPGTP